MLQLQQHDGRCDSDVQDVVHVPASRHEKDGYHEHCAPVDVRHEQVLHVLREWDGMDGGREKFSSSA